MALIFSFLLFILLCFVVFYLPGRWITRKVQFLFPNSLALVTVSIATGIALFLVVNYALAWLQLPYIYLLLPALCLFLELPKTLHEIKGRIPLQCFFSIESLILFIGCIVMGSVTALSGIGKNGMIVFYGINALDGIYHSALIGNLIFQFPPTFPGLSHAMLHGYHFLYDFMLSRFAIFFGFNSYDLYFRFFSFFTALFYGLAGLTLSYSMNMNRLTRRVFLFLLFFAQGAEFFLFHWFHGADVLYDSGIVQPAGNIVDPSVLFSMAFVFLLYVTVFSYKKKSQLLLPILFLGILPGIKIYTAILTYGAFLIVTAGGLLKRKIAHVFLLVAAGIISFAIYAPFNLGAGSLIFNPFLFFRHFMESDRVLASYQWILKLQVYEAHHNIPRIVYLYLIALLFYFVPPLGIRLVSATQVKQLVSKKFYTPHHIFWISFILIGFLLPTFFIQSVGVFNTVQFFWLIWIALLIPTAFSLVSVIGKPTFIKTSILCICLIIISVPVLKLPFITYQENVLSVTQEQLAIANTIQKNIPHAADILVVNRESVGNDTKNIYEIPLFAALSRRPFYYEPEAADFSQSQKIEKTRKDTVSEINSMLSQCPNTTNTTLSYRLNQIRVQYILLLQSNVCMDGLSSFIKVATHGSYSLYKLK